MRIAVAERVDIIVDFSKIKAASRLYLVNRAEQVNGRGPTGKVLSPGTPVLQINSVTGATVDCRMTAPIRPSVRGRRVGMKLRDLPDMDFAALQSKAAKLPTRTWRFERGSGGWMVNGKFFDENVVECRHPSGSGRSLDHPEPGRFLASPGAHPLRRASDAVAQRRTG